MDKKTMPFIRRIWKGVEISFVVIILSCVFWFLSDYSATKYGYQGYGRTDFAVFYITAQAVTSQQGLAPDLLLDQTAFRETVKSLRTQSGGTKYLYSLSSSVLFSPLAIFSYSVAWKLWINISFLSLVGAYYLFIWTWLKASPLQMRYSFLFLAIGLSDSVRKLFSTGQVNGVLFLLMIIGGLSLVSQKKTARLLSVVSGSAFGIVAVVKYFSIGFLPLLFLRKQWYVLIGFVVGILTVVSLSLLVFSPQDVAQYAFGVHDSAVQGELSSDDSTTLRGSYKSALKEGKTIFGLSLNKKDSWSAYRVFRLFSEVITVVSAAIIGGLYLRDWKQAHKRLWVLDYTIAMSFILLFAGASHRQFHLFLLPFIIWCFSRFVLKRWKEWRQYMLPILGIVLLALTQYYNWTTPSPTYTIAFIKPPTFGIALMLVSACYFRFRTAKKTDITSL